MNYDQCINSIKRIINTSYLSIEKKNTLESQLNKIKKRISDPNIYLGIVGEFSSGKSTLINSLIGADFFVTNALQGTTTVITKLVYGNKVNLTLNYINGTQLTYSKNKRKLLERYLPNEYEQLPLLTKIIIRIKDFFNLNKQDEYLMKIFDDVTTSNEISETLTDVLITYPSQTLENGIVIVDTPGTDSLNPNHTIITQKAIKEVCDIAMVVVPATQPLSLTMVEFLDDNLQESKDKCIYFITKIELFKKAIERMHIHNGVIQRINSLLDVESPHTILAPTLLSLEQRGIIEKSNIIKLTEEECISLASSFDCDIKKMIKTISENKEATIRYKIGLLISRLQEQLETEINNIKEELAKEIELTRFMRVKPLTEFMDNFYIENSVIQLSYIESIVYNCIASKKSSFKNYVFNKIDSCTTKDAVQSTMENQDVKSYGQSCFNDCYDTFTNVLTLTKKSFVSNFDLFRTKFTEMFSIDAICFEYTIKNNPNWQRAYNFNYNTSNLTTFPIFRFFRSLNSIKEQMKSDVGPKIDAEFNTMENYYVKRINESYSGIEKQMLKVKKIFIKEYEQVIDQCIRDSKRKEQQLNEQLILLQSNIQQVKNLSTPQ